MAQSSLYKSIVASMCNFLAAGAIVAGGSNLTLWQKYLGLDASELSWLNALSANAGGAAIGAFFGGFLADRFGRRNVFTWNMLTLMVGIILSMTANSFVMLLSGFIVTGIAVGTSIPASWTYICECSGDNHRGRNIAKVIIASEKACWFGQNRYGGGAGIFIFASDGHWFEIGFDKTF